jgi:hypothetical protein
LEKHKKQAVALPFAVMAVLSCAGVMAAPPSEYEVKAAFIHNIAKFVEWPASVSTRGILRLCVMGRGFFGEAATGLQGKTVGSRIWEVVPASTRANLSECQLLFIEASEADKLPHLLDGLKGSPVLTLGDTEGYGQRGVMVNFYLEQNRVRFEINPAATSRAGFKISSQLLKLARIVQPAGGAQ